MHDRRLEEEIEQRKQAEDKLQRHQRIWERAQKAAHLGSWSSHPTQHGELIWSPEIYRIFGVDEKAFVPKVHSFFERVHPEDRHLVEKASREALAGIRPYHLEHRILRPDGSVRWVLQQAEVLRDADGRPVEMIGICWDITERRQAEDRLKKFFLLSLDLFCVAGTDGYFRQLNPAFERVLGYTTEELLSRPFVDFVHPEDYAPTQAVLQTQVEGQEVLDFTNRYRCKDGSYRYLSWRAGQPQDGWIYAVARDITSQKAAEAALFDSEARFRQIADHIRDVFWITELPSLRISYVSPACTEVWGQPPQAFYDDPDTWANSIVPSERQEVVAKFQQAEASGTFELSYRIVRPDGAIRWINDRGFLVKNDAGVPVRWVGIAQDVTEQKRGEEARFIRRIAEGLPHIMYVYDIHTQRQTYINRPITLELGYTEEETRQIDHNNLSPLFHPDDKPRWEEFLGRWDHIPDGVTVPTELRLRNAQGKYHWIQCHEMVFTRSEDGRVQQIIGTAQDITYAKLAEQNLRQALHEKDALLKEVHHRVKNNLQIVISLLNLQASHIKDPDALHAFQETRLRIRSMALLHETLYQSANFADIDFPQYVQTLCQYLFRSFGIDKNTVNLTLDIAPIHLDLDRAIPCGLIIIELVSNALKYAFPKGRRGALLVRLQAVEQGQMRLTVHDDGVGMAVDFDPAACTTLGMQLVHDLATQLHGSVQFENASGSCISVTFEV